MRLSAYSGVMAARVYEAQQAENRGAGATPRAPGGMPTEAPRNDPNLVTKLTSEGWIEHNVERA